MKQKQIVCEVPEAMGLQVDETMEGYVKRLTHNLGYVRLYEVDEQGERIGATWDYYLSEQVGMVTVDSVGWMLELPREQDRVVRGSYAVLEFPYSVVFQGWHTLEPQCVEVFLLGAELEASRVYEPRLLSDDFVSVCHDFEEKHPEWWTASWSPSRMPDFEALEAGVRRMLEQLGQPEEAS